MIKAKTVAGDLLFGITAENVKRLKEGEPIRNPDKHSLTAYYDR